MTTNSEGKGTSFRKHGRRGGCRCSIFCMILCCVSLFLLSQVLILPLLLSQSYDENAATESQQSSANRPPSPLRISRRKESSVQRRGNEQGETNNQTNNNTRQTPTTTTSPPDAFFNGYPVYHRVQEEEGFFSRVHCVGENFQPNAWLERSCSFSRLCFDMNQTDFVLFQSHQEEVLTRFLHVRPFMTASSTMSRSVNETNQVSSGGINRKWNAKRYIPNTTEIPPILRWFPRVENASGVFSYYELPPTVVMVPYHSMAAMNPGHLIWDDFLPIFTLLSMFQLADRDLLLLRLHMNTKLWASCEYKDNEKKCSHMIDKFKQLLLGDKPTYDHHDDAASNNHPMITTTKEFQWNLNDASTASKRQQASHLVCASRGAAGLAPLTDHGIHKNHGWMRNDYKTTHNHGRGALFYDFRNFMLRNLHLPIAPVNPNPPYKIIFSLSSSDIPARALDFEVQMAVLSEAFSKEDVAIEAYILKDLSLQEQVRLASEASIFVSICGGGAVTAMFLPKGASVILYYLQHGGSEYGVLTHLPAELDWDLFNNLSYLRVHWLPTTTMDQKIDLRALVLLVQHELEIIAEEALSR